MAEESRIDELSQSESCADDNTIPPTQPDKLQPAPSGMAFLKSKTQQIYVIIKLTQNSMISALLMNDVAPVFFFQYHTHSCGALQAPLLQRRGHM